MSRLGNISLKLDRFFTDTRIESCQRSIECRFGCFDSFGCQLKKVSIDKDGKCSCFEEKDKKRKRNTLLREG
ncbi:MAG: hypothetical protein ACTSQY_10860 [Candidatus Odinarchaeia archaeon]